MKVTLKNVKAYQSRGRWFYYHRPTRIRLKAEPGTPEFFAEVERLNKQVENREAVAVGTLTGLMTAYRKAPEFTNLADSTKADYLDVMDWLKPLGDKPLASWTTPFVVKLRDKAFEQHKRRFANYVVQVLSILFNWGKPRGLTKSNPAEKVSRIRKPRGEAEVNRPWEPEEFDAVMEAMPAHLLVAIALGAYAGLRQGDVIRLPWSAYDGRMIQTKQAKTGDPVWVPAHSELRAILDHAPREGVTIVVGKKGAFTESGFRASFFKVIRELTAAGKVKPGLTFHGLRHTAATMLADAGCDDRDIMAITGHKTVEMVRKYTRKADQRRRAEAAIVKLEEYTRQLRKERSGV